jgi:Domain of unknown function (DUF4129)
MSGARRLMLGGVGLIGLLALVAVASRAHKPGGGSGAAAANPPQILWEYLASIMVVLLPLGTIVMFWGLAYGRRQKVLSGQRSWRRTVAMFIVMIPFLVGGYFVVRHYTAPPQTPTIAIPPNPPAQPQKNGKGGNRTPKASLKSPPEVKFQWLGALIFGSLLLATVVTMAGTVYWRRLHGEAWDQEAAMLEAIDEVLADTLDDLRAEKDPRRAVIRTYARMERTFAAYGTPRLEAEAPQEYVGRVLDRLGVSSSAVRRITDLYSRAKFSSHEIHAGMKDEAIEALVGLRAELEYKEGQEAA